MKKDNAKKQKPSPKTSKIECLSTGMKGKKLRSDAKYALPLYGKRESDYRKKMGYVENISGFLKNGLEKFYNEDYRQRLKNPFKEQIKAFIRAKSSEEMNHPWKHEFENFILYYFPQLAPHCYEIFCNEKGKKAWESYNNALKSNPTPVIEKRSYKDTSNARIETTNKTFNGSNNRTELLIIVGVIIFVGGVLLGYNLKTQR